jgi:hypothetical protein
MFRHYGIRLMSTSSNFRDVVNYVKDVQHSTIDAALLPVISTITRTREQLDASSLTKNTDISVSISIPGLTSITLTNKPSQK